MRESRDQVVSAKPQGRAAYGKAKAAGGLAKVAEMRVIVRVIAAALGAYLGFLLGFAIAFYSVDHGDVGSAATTLLWVPLGILVGSIGAYTIAAKIQRRFEQG